VIFRGAQATKAIISGIYATTRIQRRILAGKTYYSLKEEEVHIKKKRRKKKTPVFAEWLLVSVAISLIIAEAVLQIISIYTMERTAKHATSHGS
jgi:hypothetical protein